VLKLIALVAPLALDSFVVAAALGASGLDTRGRWRISLVFAACEAGMPLVGLGIGAPLGHALGAAADFLAAALLAGLGLYLLLDRGDEGGEAAALVGARGWATVALGISVSLDELAIGFSFGVLRAPVLPALAVIAAQAVIASQLGLRLGARLSVAARESAETLAGVLLLLIGVVVAAQRV